MTVKSDLCIYFGNQQNRLLHNNQLKFESFALHQVFNGGILKDLHTFPILVQLKFRLFFVLGWLHKFGFHSQSALDINC